jgi:glycosyltransferase involved in cell wall biosynthesis
MKTISIAIPTYNRYELTLESFADVIDDPRIEEIILSDDASDLDLFYTLKAAVSTMPKVKLYRNITNQDCNRNKMTAICLCKSDYVVIFDSDNRLNTEYLDAIYNEDWDEKVIFAPSFARETFDYRAFSGLTVTKENINEYFDKPFFSTMCNTMNFFVNRNEFLNTFDYETDPVTADSIYFNYLWLAKGNKIKVVEGMEYFHRVHAGSHYVNNNHRTGNFYSEVESKIRQLK